MTDIRKDKLQKWLDDLIKGFELMSTPYDKDGFIRGIEHWEDNKRIHISGSSYEYIPAIANILDILYYEENDGGDEWPLERSFTYKGYKFFSRSQGSIDDTEETKKD